MKLTKADLDHIRKRGLTEQDVNKQFERLVAGSKRMNILRACTTGDGIIVLSENERQTLINRYDASTDKTIKFTPASGAATRMFKHLINPGMPESREDFEQFFNEIEKFAFYPLLEKALGKKLLNPEKRDVVLDFILGKDGLRYGSLPKALIHFHRYGDEIRKAIDEHMVESARYLATEGRMTLHFTISENHRHWYERHLQAVLSKYEQLTGLDISVDFSYQSPATDTIALSPGKEIVRTVEGDILFRPGGHGALIGNLNALDGDLVFLKNIDNIAREEYHAEVAHFKKVLGGKLLEVRDELFALLNEYDAGNSTPGWVARASAFYERVFGVKPQVDPSGETWYAFLNRPLRICGMVKNEGKPGGGPFWVEYEGTPTVQIVESAQFAADEEQQSLLRESTHFNPVDIVCSIKDHRGNFYNLSDYVDHDAYFVSNKVIGGRESKVLEHPGLWNGAMAHWHTLFVEVPVDTFHPVKSVNDLLSEAHSGYND